MKNLYLGIILLILQFSLTAQVTLERIKVTDEISMKVPSSFIPMVEAERNRKYVSSREPMAMYTNEARTVDIGVNENSSRWGSGDLAILKDFYKANILSLHTEVSFISEDIRQIEGKDFIFFEFKSKVYKEGSFNKNAISKYTIIQYTLRNEKVLLFNFSAPLRDQSLWQETAREVMASIRFKK